jgi:hypothetical protein
VPVAAAGLQSAQAFGGADGIRFAGECGLEAGQVDSVVEREIRGDHRAMKDGKAEAIEKMQLDAGEIAVGEEWLWVLLDE